MSENVAVVCNITGVTPDQAATLLEMSNGSVEAAIGLFFETGVPENKGIDNIPHINKQIDEEEIAEEEELMKEKKQNIQPTVPHGENVDVGEFMKKAIEHGAKSIDEVGEQKKEVFVGTGHKVGEQGKISQSVVLESKQDKRRIITLYKDCFTLDNGPPRKFDDPANREFLEAIRNGRYPLEVQPKYGEELDVELIEKNEEWKPTPKDIKAFDGPVQSMGAGKAQNALLSIAKPLVVDSSKPSGSIKVRFLDGSNSVVKVNHDHTIGELRSHLESVKPCKKPFLLSIQSSGFPLTDISVNVKDAGVVGAAIVQSV